MDSRFCVKVDWPKLSSTSEDAILNFVDHNRDRLVGWSFLNGTIGNTASRDSLGFSNIRITDNNELDFFKSILETNNIFLNYENIIIAIQRSKRLILPHTDPNRSCTLQYLIKGKAKTRFWSMENFIPNISYHNKHLKLEAEFDIDLHSWYLYNNSAIHSAHDIDDERVQLAIVLHNRFKDFEEAKLNLNSILL